MPRHPLVHSHIAPPPFSLRPISFPLPPSPPSLDCHPDVRRVVAEADGYQPHLIAPEGGYRRLIEGALQMFKGPAEAVVDEVHFILRDLVRVSVGETTVSGDWRGGGGWGGREGGERQGRWLGEEEGGH